MNSIAHILVLAGAGLSISASPADRTISHPTAQGEAPIIPADSTLRFQGWDKYGYAKFKGSLVIIGTYIYGCAADCEGPIEDEFIRLDVVPDKTIAARLPHWKLRDNDRLITITGGSQLAHLIATRKQYAEMRSGRTAYLRGRVSIVVDDFRTGIECDSANFTARFVRIVKAPIQERIELNGTTAASKVASALAIGGPSQ